jgi:hypothetical protein
MRFQRTLNTPAALTAVIAVSFTSFPGHDLGTETRQAHRVLRAESFGGAGRGIPTFQLGELRSPLLPFAAPLLSHNHLAAA